MIEREKPYPWMLLFTSLVIIVIGISAWWSKSDYMVSGFCFGWGSAVIIFTSMFWASPMNERRK